MHLVRPLLALFLLLPLGSRMSAQQPNLQDVSTTRVLAIGKLTGPRDAGWQSVMPKEVHDTVALYLQGKIDQWYVRKDGQGVVFLMNVSTVDEAHTLLEKLPLGQSGKMTFDLIPLGPLTPLRFLMGDQPSAAPAPPAAKP